MNMSIIANHKPFIIPNPRESSLHFPSSSISTELSTILCGFLSTIGAMRAYKFHTFLFKPIAKAVAICRSIINQAFYLSSRTTTSSSWNPYFFKRRFDELDFRGRGRVQVVCQRNSLTIHHHHPLRTLSAFGFSNAEPPFLAGAKLPSANDSSHSNRPCSSKSDRYACHAFRRVPSSAHRQSRLQQVDGEGYSRGRSFHRAPLRNNHKTPSNIGRFEIGFGPPLGEATGSGKCGSSLFHCSSVNSSLYRHIRRGAPFCFWKSSLSLIYISSMGLV
jgi:hypothetical protein